MPSEFVPVLQSVTLLLLHLNSLFSWELRRRLPSHSTNGLLRKSVSQLPGKQKQNATPTARDVYDVITLSLYYRLIDPQDPDPCISFFMRHNLTGAYITAMPNLTEVSNLLYRCGNGDIFHHRILRLFLTKVAGGLPCEHPFIEAVGAPHDAAVGNEHYHCLDCKSRVLDPVKIEREREKRNYFLRQQQAGREMRSSSSTSQSPVPPIGVSIAWVVNFTQEHNCWHLPTWLVRRLYVLPLTSQTHCSYANLPHMQEEQENDIHQTHNTNQNDNINDKAITGPAHTFICHKWSENWGDLVRALSEHTNNWNLKVFIDVFCCNPYEFPNTSPNSGLPDPPAGTPQHTRSRSGSADPLSVMKQCEAFLLISPTLENITNAQVMSQGLSENEAVKLKSPSFWDGERRSEASV